MFRRCSSSSTMCSYEHYPRDPDPENMLWENKKDTKETFLKKGRKRNTHNPKLEKERLENKKKNNPKLEKERYKRNTHNPNGRCLRPISSSGSLE